MLSKLKSLIKHSLIYSISNVASKASGLILLPIYTSYFSVEEFGRLGLLLITILIISQFIQLGQNQSIVRLTTTAEYEEESKSIFFSIFIFVFCVVIIFFVLSFSILKLFPNLFITEIDYSLYVKICVFIISFFVLNNIFMNKLRASEQSGIYTIINMLKLSATLVISVYLIVVQNLGIESVLYAQLIGEILSFIVVLPSMMKQMELNFNVLILKEALKFGLPLIFSTLAINLLNGSDRYMLKFLAGEKAIGLYELGYRVSSILNMLIVTPIGISLLPAAYKMYKQQGDKNYYSSLLTYLTIGMVWAGISLAFFGNDIIKIFALNSDYYPASDVVPIIILSFVFFGLSMVSSLGMYLTGKTVFVAVITFFSALLNIALNYIFIPEFGMMGAAVNSTISFFILFVLSSVIANRYYSIPFEFMKVFILISAGVLLFIGINSLEMILTTLVFISLRIVCIIAFPIIIYNSNVLSRNEKMQIVNFIKKMKIFNS